MPDHTETDSVITEHASLIHRVVMHCRNPGSVPDLELVLQQATANGWEKLVAAIRKLMLDDVQGIDRASLDAEDTTIIDAMIRGLQDPDTLPPMEVDLGSRLSQPGIAGVLYAGINGNPQAVQIMKAAQSQMAANGGDMGLFAARVPDIVAGERSLEVIASDMTDEGRQMTANILDELKSLEQQADGDGSA